MDKENQANNGTEIAIKLAKTVRNKLAEGVNKLETLDPSTQEFSICLDNVFALLNFAMSASSNRIQQSVPQTEHASNSKIIK